MMDPILSHEEFDWLKALVPGALESMTDRDVRTMPEAWMEVALEEVTRLLAHSSGRTWEVLDLLAAKLVLAQQSVLDQEGMWSR